jgi:multiple sugar transport system permease protein
MASAAQKRIKSISYAKYGYLFILPFFLVYGIFQLWPLIKTFILSLYGNGNKEIGLDFSGTMLYNNESNEDFVGLDNFKALLFGGKSEFDNATVQHEEFVLAFKNTIILWVGNFIPQIILSLSLAVWFTDAKLKIAGKGFFKVVMYMPNIITAASVSVLFLSLCAKNGPINQIITGMGFDAVEMTAGKNARPVVMFIQTWMWFGNTMIMLMSGIMGISPSLFEAADIDGASSMQTFWRVTLPLLSPIMVYTVVTSMIGGLQMFDIPYLFHTGTEVNPEIRTIAVYILQKYQNQNGYQFGYAGAASVILFVFTAALGSITFIMNRDKDEVLKRKQRKMLIKQAKAKKSQFGGLGI